MACATFGLVLGGLIGGPVARYLVKHSSSPDGTPDDQVAPTAFEKPDVGRVITSLVLIESIALIAICLTLGKVVAQLLAGSVFELPTFVCVLFIGVILSNSLALAGLYRVFDRAVSVLGNVSLSLFLAMALMSLKLWELASLALPMIIILAVAGAGDGAVCGVRHLSDDGQKLRCRGAGSRALRVWPGGQRRRRSPICRRLPTVSGHRIWPSW
ncbi:Sodium/glutamate symport protein [Klebsiella pneumoniae]|uniref:Sodium/glutamate symport protein n=1 Tax=Klebsiella pneumoniae TaxID=573 RepID=A0A4P0YIL5_KLEPN|nr:Sodium/glutamate symport protein [Klebsiella pneumoniae]